MRYIPLFSVHMPKQVDKPLLEVLHSGYIGQGPKVDEFEKNLAKFLGTPNILTLNSGTSSLQLALRLAGVGFGDDVISTPMTCSATNEPILAAGANIIWADVDSQNGLIDPSDIERKITKKTKAIVGVDWGGTVCDWDEIMKIGRKHNVKVIEDAAHAFGAKYKKRMVGTIADFTCFSFQAIKHITTVDGGLLSCLNKKDYKKGKLLRWYGIDREAKVAGDSRISVDIPDWGYKLHMNDVAATIGIVQLRYIKEILAKHRKNAKYFLDHLDSSYYIHPSTKWNQDSTYWIYTLILPTETERIEFMEFMGRNGVAASRVHRRNDEYTAFPKSLEKLDGVTNFYDREACIPSHWALTKMDLEKIAELCKEFSESKK